MNMSTRRFPMSLSLSLSLAVTLVGLQLGGCESSDDDDAVDTNEESTKDDSTTDETTTDETTEDEETTATDSTTDETTDETTGGQSIVDIALGDPQFSTLVAALQAADLVDTLAGDGPFTVFAPPNSAFEALPDGALDALLADKDALKGVLLHHVVAGATKAADLDGISHVDAVGGQPLLISTKDGVSISGSKVIAADIIADNGVIHVVDQVILPPSQTIAEIVTANEDFSTLLAAVSAADLAETLGGDGPFTVFAPTNAAFDKLPEGTVEALLDDKEALTQVLLYHVVSGRAYSGDLSDGQKISTLATDAPDLMVSIGDDVMIGDATVTAVDVLATNGVVHVIDSVLVPPSL